MKSVDIAGALGIGIAVAVVRFWPLTETFSDGTRLVSFIVWLALASIIAWVVMTLIRKALD